MIECHYELSISYNGRHYARVLFNSDEVSAKRKAKQIREAMINSFGHPPNWSTKLTFHDCRPQVVEF